MTISRPAKFTLFRRKDVTQAPSAFIRTSSLQQESPLVKQQGG